MKKKGLSDVITSVLVILLSIAAVIIVWAFVRNLIVKSTEGVDAGEVNTILSIPPKYVKLIDGNVGFRVVRESGDADLKSLVIILEGGGKSVSIRKEDVDLNVLESVSLEINYAESGISTLSSIAVAPVFVDSKGNERTGRISDKYIIKAGQNTGGQGGGEEPECEDGNIDAGEDCEFDAGAETCIAQGYYGGSIGCYPKGSADECTFDISGCYNLPYEAVANYRLDGDAKDNSQNGLDGLVNGVIFASGKMGEAASFDGVNDYINLSNNGKLNITKDITIVAWVYPKSVSNRMFIISKNNRIAGSSVRNMPYAFSVDTSSKLRFERGSANDYDDRISTETVPINQWSHVGITLNGGTYTFYINGAVAGTGGIVANGGDGNSLDVIIGGYSKIDSSFWDGRIDEIIIFDRSLTSSEVFNLYNNYNLV